MHSNHCYVYIIECSGFYKVGITANIKRRLSHIDTSNPNPVSVVDKFKMDSKFIAARSERLAHNALKKMGMHVKGEWFSCDDYDLLRDVVNQCCMKYNTKENRVKSLIIDRMNISKRKSKLSFKKMTRKERFIIVKKKLHESKIYEFTKENGPKKSSEVLGIKQGLMRKIAYNQSQLLTIKELDWCILAFDQYITRNQNQG